MLTEVHNHLHTSKMHFLLTHSNLVIGQVELLIEHFSSFSSEPSPQSSSLSHTQVDGIHRPVLLQ